MGITEDEKAGKRFRDDHQRSLGGFDIIFPPSPKIFEGGRAQGGSNMACSIYQQKNITLQNLINIFPPRPGPGLLDLLLPKSIFSALN